MVIAGLLVVVLPLLLGFVPQVSRCPDVQIIGVRGSGQSGYGQQVGDVVDSLGLRLTRSVSSVSVEPLEYPAISVSDSFGLVLLNGEYDRSVAAGVGELRRVIDDVTETCRDTRIVLVGYSQGAQVIKQAMENTTPRARIASVVLLADPTRDPSQIGVTRLGGRDGSRGGSFGSIALPGYLRTVTVDVCVEDDGVCQRGVFGFFAHTDGYAAFTEAATARVMRFITAQRINILRFF